MGIGGMMPGLSGSRGSSTGTSGGSGLTGIGSSGRGTGGSGLMIAIVCPLERNLWQQGLFRNSANADMVVRA